MDLFSRLNKAFQQEVFSYKEVNDLVEEIKKYNAGVIDEHLSKYIDFVFENWLRQKRN